MSSPGENCSVAVRCFRLSSAAAAPLFHCCHLLAHNASLSPKCQQGKAGRAAFVLQPAREMTDVELDGVAGFPRGPCGASAWGQQ